MKGRPVMGESKNHPLTNRHEICCFCVHQPTLQSIAYSLTAMKRSRTTTGNLTRLLGSGATPLFVLNAQRKVLVFNRGCEELTGWAADEIVGGTCHYGSSGGSPLENLTASLCPPPEVFTGQEAVVPAFLVDKEGKSLPRMLSYFPFRDDEGRVCHVVGLATEIPRPASAVDPTPAQALHAELAALRGRLRTRFATQTLVCRSPATARLLNQIELAKQCRAAVFLKGEPGTGKEHTARVIHYAGESRNTAFVALDCRRLSPSEVDRTVTRLLEAVSEPAAINLGVAAGSLYLANVESLARDVQRRLVKAMTAETAPPLRLFSSSTVDLAQAVNDEVLLHELDSLLTTMTVELPPLRDREDDLPLLAQHFLEEANRSNAKQIGGFAGEVLSLFTKYNWPGNLAELFKVVRESHEAAAGELIQSADLPFRFRTGFDAQQVPPPDPEKPIPLESLLTEYETKLITEALRRCKQNKSQAADLLQINRPKLYRRMVVLGIEEHEPE